MASWRSTVVHPLGLAGYALACVFGLLARFGPNAQYPWLAPTAVAMAVVALLGGLLLALLRRTKTPKVSDGDPSRASVTQSTKGDKSPAIVSSGSVSINYGEQTPGKTKS